MQEAAPLGCYGQKGSIGATALQITATATKLNNGVTVRALSANAHKVYVGDSSVAVGTGYELAAGEAHLFKIIDASTLWVVSGGTGDAVCFEGS